MSASDFRANIGAHDVLPSGGRVRAGIIVQQNEDVFSLVVIDLYNDVFNTHAVNEFMIRRLLTNQEV